MISKAAVEALLKLVELFTRNLVWDRGKRRYGLGYKQGKIYDPESRQWKKKKAFSFRLTSNEYHLINEALHQNFQGISLTGLERMVIDSTIIYTGENVSYFDGSYYLAFLYMALGCSAAEKRALTRVFQKLDCAHFEIELRENRKEGEKVVVPEIYRPKRVLIDRGRKNYAHF